jgi:hypothetical protein
VDFVTRIWTGGVASDDVAPVDDRGVSSAPGFSGAALTDPSTTTANTPSQAVVRVFMGFFTS